MNISTVNLNNTKFNGYKFNPKVTNLAYSSLFTLSLLSSIGNMINGSTKDTFTKTSNDNSKELIYSNAPTELKAQNVYTDFFNNRWVPYSAYEDLLNDKKYYQGKAERSKQRTERYIQEMKEYSVKIQEMQAYINEAEAQLPLLEQQAQNCAAAKDDANSYLGSLNDIEGRVLAVGAFLGVVAGIIARLGYNLYNNKIKPIINNAKQHLKL